MVDGRRPADRARHEYSGAIGVPMPCTDRAARWRERLDSASAAAAHQLGTGLQSDGSTRKVLMRAVATEPLPAGKPSGQAVVTRHHTGRRYSSRRLYGAPRAFLDRSRSWLRGVTPVVLHTDDVPRILALNLSFFSSLEKQLATQRRNSGGLKRTRASVPRAYNPSIARSPVGLCARCEWVVAVRVDSLHQCHRRGAISSGFLGCAIAVLDEHFSMLGWTWLFNSCNRRPFFAASVQTPPPWLCPQRDVRLLNVGGRLLMTFHGSDRAARRNFFVDHLQLQASERADGSVSLRAWMMQEDRATVTFSKMQEPIASWLAGRNQALFAVADETGSWHLLVQPWIHLVASLGKPRWAWAKRPSALVRQLGCSIWFIPPCPCQPDLTQACRHPCSRTGHRAQGLV